MKSPNKIGEYTHPNRYARLKEKKQQVRQPSTNVLPQAQDFLILKSIDKDTTEALEKNVRILLQ